MATAQEQYRIAQNILARVGIDGNLISEHAKAMATLHGMQTMNEMNVPQSPQATMSGQPDQSTTQPLNTPTMPQNEGNGELNLPM
jgi:hypothetical protein